MSKDNLNNLKVKYQKRNKLRLEKSKIKYQRIVDRNEIISKRHEDYSEKYSSSKNKILEKRINGINKRYDSKIANIKEEISKLDKKILDSQLENNKKSMLVQFYSWKIKSAENKYSRMNKKVDDHLYIEKISSDEANDRRNEIEIEKNLVLTRLSERHNHFLKQTHETRLNEKMKRTETQRINELETAQKRKSALAPNNILSAVKDQLEDLKSMYVWKWKVKDIFASASKHFKKYSMFYILLLVILLFAGATKGNNLKSATFTNILEGNTYILIMGLGMLLVIVSGNIDLSVGSLMGFMGAVSVMIYNTSGSLFVTILLVLLIGAAVGIGQGILIGYFRIPSFIVTLGGMLLFQGLILRITKSKTLIPFDQTYKNFVTKAMPDITIGNFHLIAFLIIFLVGIMAAALMIFGRIQKTKYGVKTDNIFMFAIKITILMILFTIIAYFIGTSRFGLKYYIIYILVLVLFFMFLMQNTSFGRKIYAIGGNSKAAVLSGINKGMTTTLVFMIMGMLASFAGIIFTGIATSASPTISGNGYELDVISSVFVGGASMAGGIGTIPGTFIGGLILGYINSGMLEINLGSDMQKIVKGIILVAVVGYDVYANRKIG